MSDWHTVACLLTLRGEFNAVAPKRDKGADGTIGDTAHAAGGTSDHLPDEDFPALRGKDADKINEVHALDVDSTGPWPDGRGGEAGGWFDRKIHEIIAEERRRWLDPNDMCRLRYVIWRGHIYHLDNDFAPKVYTGSPDKHFDHAHFSARYETQAENDTRPWGVSEDDMPFTPQDFAKAMADYEVWNPYAKRLQKLSEIWGFTPSRAPHEVTQQQLAGVSAQLAALAGRTNADIDEAAIVQGILAGLDDAVAQRFLDQLAERFNLRLVPVASGDTAS